MWSSEAIGTSSEPIESAKLDWGRALWTSRKRLNHGQSLVPTSFLPSLGAGGRFNSRKNVTVKHTRIHGFEEALASFWGGTMAYWAMGFKMEGPYWCKSSMMGLAGWWFTRNRNGSGGDNGFPWWFCINFKLYYGQLGGFLVTKLVHTWILLWELSNGIKHAF